MSANTSIPVLDATAYLGGCADALETLGESLRHALEHVGFYYLRGHGVDPKLIDSVFAASRCFHALPEAQKLRIRANEHNVGYMPLNGYVSRSSRISESNQPNLVEALFVKRDLPSDHPDVIANKRFRPLNQWPSLDGFRETVVAYCDALELLCLRLLPVYAVALDLRPNYFEAAFAEPQYTLRMSHYPPSEIGFSDQYGVAPHTDSSFLTVLAQSELPGLSIQTPAGKWIDAPVIEDAFLVNSGDMLRRWANHRFLSTAHRVVNRNPGKDRYAIPFFFDASVDYPMACLETCVSEANPARYDPITYTDYMVWFSNQYDHVREQSKTNPRDPGVPD